MSTFIAYRRALRLTHGGARALQRAGYCLVTASEDGGVANNGEHPPAKPSIPLVPKSRDPNAVLKALSSTIEPLPDPLLFGGRSKVDALYPRNRGQYMRYMRARESGKMAAQYVIRRWPEMFPNVEANPDLRPNKPTPKKRGEEAIKMLVLAKRPRKALEVYHRLLNKGKTLSLDTQNSLLALVAHFGLGNRSVSAKEAGEVYKHSQFLVGSLNSRDEAGAGLDHAENDMEEVEEQGDAEQPSTSKLAVPGGMTVWRAENEAEKIFSSMMEKNGSSYDAMIVSLVKFKDYRRAFELFLEMREKDLQANLATYNTLLTALVEKSNVPQLWKKAKNVLVHMTKGTVVTPDVNTINLLLDIASKSGSSSQQLALSTVREMAHLGIVPNLTTFLFLLKCFLNRADGSILYDITSYLENNPQVLSLQDEKDIEFFTLSMIACRLLRDHTLAMRLKKMASKDSWFFVSSEEFFLSQYLVVLATNAPIEVLKEEYREIMPKEILPQEWVFGVIFRACEEAKDPGFALEVWGDIMKYRVKTYNVETLERFCGSLSVSVDPHNAEIYIAALLSVLKKVEYLELSPPAFLMSQLIRFHVMIDNVDKAWEFYGLFEKYDIKPTFLALSSLLKSCYGHRNPEKIIEILELMIELKMFLPLRNVKDMCWNCGVPKNKIDKFLKAFGENQKARNEKTKSERSTQQMEQS